MIPIRMEKRINLEEYKGHTLEGLTPELLDEAGFEQSNAKLIAALPEIIAELKRMYEKEDEIIEYVGYLLATPDVLEQLMGSPSQIHTINNLTGSLEKLLDILKDNASK